MINCIFHKCFSESNITDDKYKGNNFDHTLKALKYIREYECPVDSSYQIPTNYTISRCDNFSDANIISGKLNIIYVPLNVALLRMLDETEPDYLETLYRHNDKNNVELVFDYNNESLLPGRFGSDSDDKWLSKIEYRHFHCSTLGWSHTDKFVDPIGFKSVTGSLAYHTFWFLRTLRTHESDYLKDPNTIFTYKGKSGPLRYYCPNNEFRASRAKMIVHLYERGMLRDTEWNMNSFKDWNRKPPEERQVMLREEDTRKYLDYFGSTPKYNSYPWNFSFNFTKQDIKIRKNHLNFTQTPHTSFPQGLIHKSYIYIANETFSVIDPDKPYDFSHNDFTEKTCKGFVFGMPMFVNGLPYVHRANEKLGFDMFRDYWTSPFDSETNMDKRIKGLVDTLYEFPESATQDIIDRLKHNKNLFVSKKHLWNIQSDLFTKLLSQMS
tara:strand:+ start:38627 stop:39940 length:1314 start_codon:yes stop_codon:yes gene_type:complete